MTRNCWRVMACMLTLSLGGLVVCADERPQRSAEPTITPVAASSPTAAPPTEPTTIVVTPLAPPPVQAAPPRDISMLVPPPAPTEVTPPVEPTPVAQRPTFDIPPMAAPTNIAPPTYQAAPTQVAQTPTAAPSNPTTITYSPFPWKLNIQMVGGMTRVELVHADEVHMCIVCEKLEMQTPGGGLRASGKVSVTGPAIEARCDSLAIAWQTGQIALEGHVRVLCQNGPHKTEVGADSACLRLKGVNSGIEFTPTDVTNQVPVRPVSY